MITAKDLSEEQKAAIAQWAAEGAQLPDIQKRLQEELGLNITYMDTRFLVLDLGVEIQPEAEDKRGPDLVGASALQSGLEAEPPNAGPGRGVTVTTDDIARAGALVSGRVRFSDGKGARWLIDDMGRLGFDPETPGYQPTEADAIAFERELRRLLDQ